MMFMTMFIGGSDSVSNDDDCVTLWPFHKTILSL